MTAQELKKERLKRGHSQASLAKALGRSLRQIIRYEMEDTDIPEVVKLALRSLPSRHKK